MWHLSKDFKDEDGGVFVDEESGKRYVPRWNTLVHFEVPRWHAVTPVVTPGKESPKASPEAVATATLDVFRRAVPAAVPGIFFLSGGQTPEEATLNLNAMNSMGAQPWELSFSYGRALQEPAQKAWAGNLDNGPEAQAAMLKRARLNGAARAGHYRPEMED